MAVALYSLGLLHAILTLVRKREHLFRVSLTALSVRAVDSERTVCPVCPIPNFRRPPERMLLQSKGAYTMTDRVEINPSVMQGKPVIRGTRIPVELLLRKLAEGAAIEDLLDAYPRLAAEDIWAALAYAADTIAHETVLELSSP